MASVLTGPIPDAGNKPPLGVSSCLLGEPVRYDGGHKRNAWIVETLGAHFELHPFCPEFEIGLGVPRKPIQLIAAGDDGIRCVQVDDSRIEHTRALSGIMTGRQRRFAGLCGYIFKKSSPSCGPAGVPVWRGEQQVAEASGIFAAALMRAFPWLPVVDESELAALAARENFIARVFVLRRWRELEQQKQKQNQNQKQGIAALTRFHARHKLTIMSHDPASYPRLGRLLAEAGKDELAAVAGQYLQGLMTALAQPASRGRHTNVLLHVLGYLKGAIKPGERRELAGVIDQYHRGSTPLAVPVEALNQVFRKHPDAYIADSWYMNPEPGELALRELHWRELS